MGLGVPKALAPLGDATVLAHALRPLFGITEPVQVIVVGPPQHSTQVEALWVDSAGPAAASGRVVIGGASRQASVAAGLDCLDPAVEVVLVHDAARALAPTELFTRVIEAVRATGAGVVPAMPVTDTITQTDPLGVVRDTLQRGELRATQTPQGFPAAALRQAMHAAVVEHTDDAAVFRAAGHQVSMIDGDPAAFKITTAWDLRHAEFLLAEAGSVRSPHTDLRIGLGVDAHRFDTQRSLWLAGLYWPEEPGLAGHSDADVVAHAICDALLAAAQLGDLGSRFGTDDPALAGAPGRSLLAATVKLVRAAGFRVRNVSVQLVAQRPRFAPRRAEAEELLSALLGAPVSIAATSTDGMGFTGTGEGAAAMATALIGGPE